MSYTAIQNVPIVVDLTKACNDTGWAVPGDGTAVHSTCNTGLITLTNYPVIAGHTYNFTYVILSISGGYLAPVIGGNTGTHYTSANINVDTLTASSNGFVQFFSNANCVVQGLNIKDIMVDDGVTKAWSAINKKWSDSRTLYPEFGLSLYTSSVLIYNGAVYLQQNGSDSRNNFFGTQYQSSIKFVEAKDPEIINDYESLNYQSNMLLVTTINGVQSSLGQLSTLIPSDFIKANLVDGSLNVIMYQKDNVYSASFLPDSTDDAVNGPQMRGSYLIVELITQDGSTPLKLFSVGVKTARIPIGSR